MITLDEITEPEHGELKIHENGVSLMNVSTVSIDGIQIKKQMTEYVYKVNGGYYHRIFIVLENSLTGRTEETKISKTKYKEIIKEMIERITESLDD